MSKLQLLASKEIWDETNPLPCVRISFLSDFSDGNLLVDWEKWVDFCNEQWNEKLYAEWLQLNDPKFESDGVNYERTLECANKWVLLDFINWL